MTPNHEIKPNKICTDCEDSFYDAVGHGICKNCRDILIRETSVKEVIAPQESEADYETRTQGYLTR